MYNLWLVLFLQLQGLILNFLHPYLLYGNIFFICSKVIYDHALQQLYGRASKFLKNSSPYKHQNFYVRPRCELDNDENHVWRMEYVDGHFI